MGGAGSLGVGVTCLTPVTGASSAQTLLPLPPQSGGGCPAPSRLTTRQRLATLSAPPPLTPEPQAEAATGTRVGKVAAARPEWMILGCLSWSPPAETEKKLTRGKKSLKYFKAFLETNDKMDKCSNIIHLEHRNFSQPVTLVWKMIDV